MVLVPPPPAGGAPRSRGHDGVVRGDTLTVTFRNAYSVPDGVYVFRR